MIAKTTPNVLAIKSYTEPDRQGKKCWITSISVPNPTENKNAKCNCRLVIRFCKYDV